MQIPEVLLVGPNSPKLLLTGAYYSEAENRQEHRLWGRERASALGNVALPDGLTSFTSPSSSACGLLLGPNGTSHAQLSAPVKVQETLAISTVVGSYLDIIQELETTSLTCSFSHSPRQVHRPLSTHRPVVAGDRVKGASPLRELAHQVNLSPGVSPSDENVCGFASAFI